MTLEEDQEHLLWRVESHVPGKGDLEAVVKLTRQLDAALDEALVAGAGKFTHVEMARISEKLNDA